MPKRVATTVERRYQPKRKCKKTVKQDANWNDMPKKLKVMIMKNMDIITRTRLKMCSKADKCLVEEFPIVIPQMVSNLTRYRPPFYSMVRIPGSISFNDMHSEDDVFKVEFHQKVMKIWKYDELREIRESWPNDTRRCMEERRNTFKEYFYNILLTKNIRIGHFETDWNLDENCIPGGHLFHFDSMKIEARYGNHCAEWLRHVAPDVKKIDLTQTYYCMSDIKGIGEMPCVLNANDLSISGNDINNEQLLNFKATQLILGASNVTVDGIKKLIEKWIDNDYPIGSRFQIVPPSTPIPTIEQLFDGEHGKVTKHGSTSKTMVKMKHKKVMCIKLIQDRSENYTYVQVDVLSKS